MSIIRPFFLTLIASAFSICELANVYYTCILLFCLLFIVPVLILSINDTIRWLIYAGMLIYTSPRKALGRKFGIESSSLFSLSFWFNSYTWYKSYTCTTKKQRHTYAHICTCTSTYTNLHTHKHMDACTHTHGYRHTNTQYKTKIKCAQICSFARVYTWGFHFFNKFMSHFNRKCYLFFICCQCILFN